MEVESNCVKSQAASAGCQEVCRLNIALRMVSSFCIQATNATFGACPARAAGVAQR